MRLTLIRHGITAWNEQGLIQGHRDLPLSVAGRAQVRSWHVPAGWGQARWFTSPLQRARQTAELLGVRPAIDPRLIEMDWGRFEGRRLQDLRSDDPTGMAANEARGLDFRPDGGERPREVVARLASFLVALPHDRPVVAVTHKGVMRAALVLATGWDMMRKAPVAPGRDQALVFEIAPGGTPALFGTSPLMACPCAS